MGVLEILVKPWIVFLVSVCLSITDCLTPVFALSAEHGTHNTVGGHWEHQSSKYRPEPTTAIAKPHRVNTVSVECHSDSMEITIKANLFNVGTFVEAEELRLGVGDGGSCRPTQSSDDEYQVLVAITDCGTKHWMTEDALTYTNHLVYTPLTSPDGLIRMSEAVIPIECHYGRKYRVASGLLTPKWIHFTSSQAAVDALEFDLKIMTDDWLHQRGSGVYFLGDPIRIEASLQINKHARLKISVSRCVATLDPASNSVPKYVFIENGCLLDSQLPGSHSQFMRRIHDDKLYFQIDAFKFHNEDRTQIFITCQLAAVPVTEKTEYHNEACTFISDRWQSADGSDSKCGHCPTQNVGLPHLTTPIPKVFGKFAPRSHGKSFAPDSFKIRGMKARKGLEHEAGVGPMLVLPAKPRSVPLPHWERSPSQLKVGRPIASGSQWRTRIDFKYGPFHKREQVGDLLQSSRADDIIGQKSPELEKAVILSSPPKTGTLLSSSPLSTSEPRNLTTEMASPTSGAVQQDQEKDEEGVFSEEPEVSQAHNITSPFSVNDTTDKMLLQKDNGLAATYQGHVHIIPSVPKNLNVTATSSLITQLESEDLEQDGSGQDDSIRE